MLYYKRVRDVFVYMTMKVKFNRTYIKDKKNQFVFRFVSRSHKGWAPGDIELVYYNPITEKIEEIECKLHKIDINEKYHGRYGQYVGYSGDIFKIRKYIFRNKEFVYWIIITKEGTEKIVAMDDDENKKSIVMDYLAGKINYERLMQLT